MDIARHKKPLISEFIEAKRGGPTIYVLYLKYKQYGIDQIGKYSIRARFKIKKIHRNILDRVIEVYGILDPLSLRGYSHSKGSPCQKVYDTQCKIPGTMYIPNSHIHKYFDKILSSKSIY